MIGTGEIRNTFNSGFLSGLSTKMSSDVQYHHLGIIMWLSRDVPMTTTWCSHDYHVISTLTYPSRGLKSAWRELLCSSIQLGLASLWTWSNSANSYKMIEMAGLSHTVYSLNDFSRWFGVNLLTFGWKGDWIHQITHHGLLNSWNVQFMCCIIKQC